jgi:glutamate/tyrosine decarboxylase-like PLP-dependent enzyme
MEGLWAASRLSPGVILASDQAHYTHERVSGVLGIPFEKTPSDDRGCMSLSALESRLAKGGVGTVVATMGATATGSVDPLREILALRARYNFRLHADAAYGGYYALHAETRPRFDGIGEADSIVVDPHKHGLQPYGCGCILFRDPAVGRLYKHDSPYTYFSSAELHLGEITLECSRAGASAVALWATQRLLPLVPDGEFAQSLASSRRAALALAAGLRDDPRWVVPFEPDLDIVIWAPRAASASAASAESQRIFGEAAKRDLHLALARMPFRFFASVWPVLQPDQDWVLCLRSVLMKPEHEAWVPEILSRLRTL